MNVIKLSEEETYAYLNKPFNPPLLSDELTEDEFFAEWHNVRDRLKAVLDQVGEHDAYGQGDFYVGDSASLSRGIGVCLTSAKLLNRDLIPQVVEVLSSLPKEYEINFTIETQDEAYEIFVSRNKVKAWLPDELLSRLLPKSGGA